MSVGGDVPPSTREGDDMKEKRKSMTWVRATRHAALAAVAVASVAQMPGVGASAAEEETLGNNLSVPLIVVPSASAGDLPALRGGACGGNIAPTGAKSAVYSDYWLQKTEATWQAQCAVAARGDVVVNWGDNLISRPVLSAKQPIRVEVALENTPASPMTGYVVDKLTPDVEDRLATYGTKGVPTAFTTVRVFDSGARLRIERTDGPGGVIYDGLMSAEVNSTGSIVYGFNWGTKGKAARALPGTYQVTFTTNATTVTGVGEGDESKATFTARSSTVTVVLSASAGRRGGEGAGSGSGGSGGGSGGGHSGGSGGGSGSGGPRR